jgi:hypothetical protein
MKKLLLYLLFFTCLCQVLAQSNTLKTASAKQSALLCKIAEQEKSSYQDASVYHHKPVFTRAHRLGTGFNHNYWNSTPVELFSISAFQPQPVEPSVKTSYASWHTSYLSHNYPSHNFW